MTTTTTRSATQTTTITGGDVRQVLRLASEEMQRIVAAVPGGAGFDADALQVELGLFLLNEVITAFTLEILLGREPVRCYEYQVADRPLEAWGPPAGAPPLGPIPNGARVRVVVTPNPAVSRELRQRLFQQYGWQDAEPLEPIPGATFETYGSFVSGGYGLTRHLLVNPKYDRPVRLSHPGETRKER